MDIFSNWVAGPHVSSICNFLRNPQTGFHGGSVSSHFYYQSVKVSVFPQPHQNLLFSLFS